MTKIDVISGFLGAGKTTLIKKLLKEAFADEKIVLIENEFGEIGIDGGFLKEAGVQITEMNSGCICCSLVGDFGTALKEVLETYKPDRVIIEPSGVGKLSDVVKAVLSVGESVEIELNSTTAVVDVKKSKMYMKNFGEFFNNQVENAGTIILSRTQDVSDEKLMDCVHQMQEHNDHAAIITTPWDKLTGKQILDAMEKKNSLKELIDEAVACPTCGHDHHGHHDHHEHEHGEGCGCGHGHHDHHEHEHGEGCGCGHGHHDHHEHEHGEGCGCGNGHHDHHEHEHGEGCGCGHGHHDHHEHEHGEGCGCGHGHHDHHEHEHGEDCGCGHDHHDHHHADEVFTSWGVETPRKYEEEELKNILETLSNSDEYGFILRAKGIIPCTTGEWMYFDLVPGEYEVRKGAAEYTGRLCVIGSKIDTNAIETLFKIK